jgi:hypothetical protein
MRYVWKAIVVVAVFVGVGLLTARAVSAHAAPGGAYALQVRLGSAMAGLFAGGVAATLTLIALVWKRGDSTRDR